MWWEPETWFPRCPGCGERVWIRDVTPYRPPWYMVGTADIRASWPGSRAVRIVAGRYAGFIGEMESRALPWAHEPCFRVRLPDGMTVDVRWDELEGAPTIPEGAVEYWEPDTNPYK